MIIILIIHLCIVTCGQMSAVGWYDLPLIGLLYYGITDDYSEDILNILWNFINHLSMSQNKEELV